MVSCFDGYNAAILAYGQTGSKIYHKLGGKTYTMGSSSSGISSSADAGILPRAIYKIFEEIDTRKNQFKFAVRASFLEIYNEQTFDLLC